MKKIKFSGFALLCFAIISQAAYCQNEEKVNQISDFPLTEFSNYYSKPIKESLNSKLVNDTFTIFKSLPIGYSKDSTKQYPLIIILDANAFFESVISELKFNTFIGLIPKSIIIGIGYKDFMTMDSLRSRDYTFPKAIPEYEMSISGGAEKFKRFIDEELIPKLMKENRINIDKSVLCGHSLAGYFTSYYALKSAQENRFYLKNIVSASPSLHYNHKYLVNMAKELKSDKMPMKMYISMGSEDMNDDESKGILDQFANQLLNKNYKDLNLKKAEYTNFGHIDAALPGFIKGLAYIFEK
ncbi:MAG: alpha/beta hydrolase [Pyrinomonadaceae bacterium]|nr:alpha/beta hydrolase [Sphingobacteriaceae bacterium]